MSSRVEHDSDVVLRLMIGKGRTGFEGPGDARFEVVNCDVEMSLHVLIAGRCRPHGWNMIWLGLERKPGASLG